MGVGAGAAAAASRPAAATDLLGALAARTAEDPDFWTALGNDRRGYGHGLFPYPAMMVPAVQGALLDAALEANPDARQVYDPYAGAGTVLIECMVRGLDFTGSDVNPFAVMICRVKATPLTAKLLTDAARRVHKRRITRARCDIEFPGRDKWFDPAVSIRLARLARAIRMEQNGDVRRFLWICLAGVVRQVSNSRTSTYKLHKYADGSRGTPPDTFELFDSIVTANIGQLGDLRQLLETRGHLRHGRCTSRVTAFQGDARDPSAWLPGRRADILMTSPPYGDNRTTIPYGQYSYLPLNWIDPNDHHSPALCSNTYAIDSACLGGRLARCLDDPESLLDRSPSLRATWRMIDGTDVSGQQRLVGFFRDFDNSLDAVLSRLTPGALMFWTLGQRRISGLEVPTTRIVSELLDCRGSVELAVLPRLIPNNRKRMALRNASVSTMAREDILVATAPDPAGQPA